MEFLLHGIALYLTMLLVYHAPVPQEDLLAMLRNQLGGDNAQSQRFFEEGTRLLQDRTGQKGLFDNVMRNLKKSSF